MRTTFVTPVGELVLDASERGLLMCGTWAKRDPVPDDSRAARLYLDAARAALSEYFEGKRRSFEDLTLAPAGTEFQLRVWEALRRIPYGSSISYGEMARRIDRPAAVRAVGHANGRNPIGIIQPCHRVVGADGSLVGFGGGLPMKAWLLRHEGVTLVGERRGSLRVSARPTRSEQPGLFGAG